MPDKKSIDDRLRSQIEAAAAEDPSTESIDQRIASALCREGQFQGALERKAMEKVPVQSGVSAAARSKS